MARKARKATPYALTPVIVEAAKEDRAAALAHFLLENTGSVFGRWRGHMKADDQRILLGKTHGKGTLIIDGNDETVGMFVSVCFGTDWCVRFRSTWSELCYGAA